MTQILLSIIKGKVINFFELFIHIVMLRSPFTICHHRLVLMITMLSSIFLFSKKENNNCVFEPDYLRQDGGEEKQKQIASAITVLASHISCLQLQQPNRNTGNRDAVVPEYGVWNHTTHRTGMRQRLIESITICAVSMFKVIN